MALTPGLSRRQFIQSLGAGLGSVGLMGMLAEQSAARFGQHLLCIASGRTFRQAPSTTSCCSCRAGRRRSTCSIRSRRWQSMRASGPIRSICAPSAPPAASSVAVRVPEVRQERRSTSASCCRTSRRSSTTSASSGRCTRSTRRTRRPAACFIPATSPRRGRRWARGSPTAWAPRTRTCPASSCSAPAAAAAPGLRSGFLPARYQGTRFDDSRDRAGKMIRNLRNTQLDPAAQRRQLDLVQQLNRDHEQPFGEDEFLEGRIQAMETAYRMQFEATDAFDVRNEPAGGPRGVRQHAVRQRLPARPPTGRARRAHGSRLLRPRPALGRSQHASTRTCAAAAPTWTRRRPP